MFAPNLVKLLLCLLVVTVASCDDIKAGDHSMQGAWHADNLGLYNDKWRYMPDTRGKYVDEGKGYYHADTMDDGRGIYNADNSGIYHPDYSGQYVSDMRGLYIDKQMPYKHVAGIQMPYNHIDSKDAPYKHVADKLLPYKHDMHNMKHKEPHQNVSPVLKHKPVTHKPVLNAPLSQKSARHEMHHKTVTIPQLMVTHKPVTHEARNSPSVLPVSHHTVTAKPVTKPIVVTHKQSVVTRHDKPSSHHHHHDTTTMKYKISSHDSIRQERPMMNAVPHMRKGKQMNTHQQHLHMHVTQQPTHHHSNEMKHKQTATTHHANEPCDQ